MPIRPENRERYPKDWKAISLRIRQRAQGQCECTGECGDAHPPTGHPDRRRCYEFDRFEHSVTGSIVILTVAHLDHTPENCADDNLKAMCQRCHNKYDAPMRRRGMKERARAALNIPDMFDAP